MTGVQTCALPISFLLSRNLLNGGAGEHLFTGVGTFGYFTKAALAAISSEVNTFRSCSFVNQYDNGHVLYTSSMNTIGVISAYISGLDTHSYSGGNTRHYYDGSFFSHYGTGAGTGRSIYLAYNAASPTTGLVFAACYSTMGNALNDSSIVIDGNCRDIIFSGHRDEAITTHCFKIVSGSTVTGLILDSGEFSRNFYAEDTSVITRSRLHPEQLTTAIDPVTGKYYSFDLASLTYSTITSIGTNGIRLRTSALGSRIIATTLVNTDLDT